MRHAATFVRPFGALVALVAVAAMAVAACAASTSSTPAPEPPTPTAVPAVTRPSGVPTAVEATAADLAFTPTELVGPAGVPFSFTLRNRDDGIPHNIVIRAGRPVRDVAPDRPDLFAGEILTGVATVTYQVPALPAGVYTFFCRVHPNMVGTLTLQ